MQDLERICASLPFEELKLLNQQLSPSKPTAEAKELFEAKVCFENWAIFQKKSLRFPPKRNLPIVLPNAL